MSLTQAIFLLLCYSFLGWCVEVAFAALRYGRFINRGFLNGPWCPIYGVGLTLVILLLKPLQHNSLALFIGAAAITTLLEYLTGVALEKLFHTRWWDYSEMPFNIGGHVCLLFSVLWGLACTFVVKLIHPVIARLYALVPQPLMIVILSVGMTALLIDAVATLRAAHRLSDRLRRIDQLAGELRKLSDELGENIYDTVNALGEHADNARDWWSDSVRPRLDALDDAADRRREQLNDRWEDFTGDVRERLDDAKDSLSVKKDEYRRKLQLLDDVMKRSAAEKRMLNAFPHLTATRYPLSLERLKEHYQKIKK